MEFKIRTVKKIKESCSGIDIDPKHIFVSVENMDVRSFETFNEGLREASSYLLLHGIKTVGMEATGVNWIIMYDILESTGLDVWLVDGRQTKQVPGRKTDVKDCQWIQQLHSHDLLNRCFVPDDQVKEIRSYQRLGEDHFMTASMQLNYMQKVLTEMNIRLKEELSQVHGASGLANIEAVLAEKRDAGNLLLQVHLVHFMIFFGSTTTCLMVSPDWSFL